MMRGAIKYGIFQGASGCWYFRTYHSEAKDVGPFMSRADAMEALLRELGFPVEGETK